MTQEEAIAHYDLMKHARFEERQEENEIVYLCQECREMLVPPMWEDAGGF